MEKISGSAKTILDKLKLSNGKSADELFTRLKVDKAGENIFGSKQFEKWANAVTKASKQDPGVAEMAMATTLTARYGDEGLANMLFAAKRSYTTRSIATNLEGGPAYKLAG